MGPGNGGQHCLSHRKERGASILRRMLAFKEMMFLEADEEKQEGKVREEDERESHCSQCLSFLAQF